jgi:uncharacterized protein
MVSDDTEDDIAENQDNPADAKLLEILVCPLTKTRLFYEPSSRELFSKAAGLAFPIRNGVPLMIEEAARKLTDADLRKIPRS